YRGLGLKMSTADAEWTRAQIRALRRPGSSGAGVQAGDLNPTHYTDNGRGMLVWDPDANQRGSLRDQLAQQERAIAILGSEGKRHARIEGERIARALLDGLKAGYDTSFKITALQDANDLSNIPNFRATPIDFERLGQAQQRERDIVASTSAAVAEATIKRQMYALSMNDVAIAAQKAATNEQHYL